MTLHPNGIIQQIKTIKHTFSRLVSNIMKICVQQTLHWKPAVINESDSANMCVLLFVKEELTDWTAVVEMRVGRQS